MSHLCRSAYGVNRGLEGSSPDKRRVAYGVKQWRVRLSEMKKTVGQANRTDGWGRVSLVPSPSSLVQQTTRLR